MCIYSNKKKCNGTDLFFKNMLSLLLKNNTRSSYMVPKKKRKIKNLQFGTGRPEIYFTI